MSLINSLPAPKHALPPPQTAPSPTSFSPAAAKEPPRYLRRQGFVPRKQEDFGDGGAFPEVHVAQYPLEMGKAAAAAGGRGGDGSSVQTLAVTVGVGGDINFDAVVNQGKNSDKIVYSRHEDLIPKVEELDKESMMEKPDDEEVKETAKETWNALQRVVDMKIQAAQPKTLGPKPGPAQYIKYTPSQQGAQFASGARQRIIKLQDMPADPLEPPKFKHRKVPRGPGDPPVPIMHSPPRPVTAKDQADWKIPPCISNWKNPKGYTIPVDSRLAADGRGLQETAVSDRFAAFTEALYTAEHKAREALHMRNKVQKEVLAREKEKKERELRELAQRARMEHGGLPLSARVEGGTASIAHGPPSGSLPPNGEKESQKDKEERKRRDDIREERRRERERERRLEARDAHGAKKSKITRDRERDVTEKVALGMAQVDRTSGEAMYDTRLFNQEKGLATGFGDDESYNLYDKPLFAERGSGLYKMKKTQDSEIYGGAEDGHRTERFKASQGFQGASEPQQDDRAGPVEFEAAVDPFGLDEFVSKAGSKRSNPLEQLGQKGRMNAAGGGSSYEETAAGSSRKRMQFK